MCPWIGTISLAFVGPPAVKVQLSPYNRVRLMRIPVLQVRIENHLHHVLFLFELAGHGLPNCMRPQTASLSDASTLTQYAHSFFASFAQSFLTKLLTVDLPDLMVLPKRLEINIPPSVTSIAEAAVGRDTIMRAVASAVLQVREMYITGRVRVFLCRRQPPLCAAPRMRPRSYLGTTPPAFCLTFCLLKAPAHTESITTPAPCAQVDSLEQALLAALPLGPQTPAGGVTLPDFFSVSCLWCICVVLGLLLVACVAWVS